VQDTILTWVFAPPQEFAPVFDVVLHAAWHAISTATMPYPAAPRPAQCGCAGSAALSLKKQPARRHGRGPQRRQQRRAFTQAGRHARARAWAHARTHAADGDCRRIPGAEGGHTISTVPSME